ncbi:FecR family protein [Saccharicrinis aurantiacus]|uniref:FecR family protein n=1 Tax=Saccharicrinis aurantiacus TaxID=1849719 RepID=UPI000837B48D|nr:FecR domain-containing protein [Saccharicrinis aurantiacus]
MEEQNTHIDEAKLVAFLEGHITAESRKEVLLWLGASEKNRSYFETVERLWLELGKMPDIQAKVDKQKAWSKLEQRINRFEDKEAKHKKRKLSWFVAAAAASIALIISLYLKPTVSHSEMEIYNFANADANSSINDTLPDGSFVTLNIDASIRYALNKNANQREISLKGEAFFDVKHDAERPFIVDVPLGSIKVLGTEFNVDATDTTFIKVALLKGSVSLNYQRNNSSDINILLKPNEEGIFDATRDTLFKRSMAPLSTYWLNKQIHFNGTELNVVLQKLEEAYAVDIDWNIAEFEDILFTSSFNDQTIDEVLQVIASTYNLELRTVADDHFVLSIRDKE